MPNTADIEAYVRNVVAELISVEPTEIHGSDRLREDLGLDSLQSMELLSRVSEQFNIDPDMDQVMKVATIDEVVTALAAVLPQ